MHWRRVLLGQCFSAGGDFAPGTFGNVWRHFRLSQLGGKARDAAKHFTVLRTVPPRPAPAKKYPTQMSVVPCVRVKSTLTPQKLPLWLDIVLTSSYPRAYLVSQGIWPTLKWFTGDATLLCGSTSGSRRQKTKELARPPSTQVVFLLTLARRLLPSIFSVQAS